MRKGKFMFRASACVSVLGVVLLMIQGCGANLNAGSGSGGTGGGNGGGNGGGPQNQPTTVNFTFVGGNPTLAAVKIGSGNYSAEAITSNQLTITVPSGTTTYSVAYLCPSYQAANVTLAQEYVRFLSTQDGTAINGSCAGPATGPVVAMGTLTGTVDATAFPTASIMEVDVSAGANGEIADGLPFNGGSFQMTGPAGSDRVVIGIYDNGYNNLLAIKNFNSQTVPGALNGGNTVTFSSSDATTPQPIAFANLAAGFATPSTYVSAVNGAFALTSGAINQYSQVPAGVLQSGDYYIFSSSSSLTSGSQSLMIGSDLYPTTGGPVTISFPAPWSTAGPAPAGLPTIPFDYTGYEGKSGVSCYANLTWTPSSGNQDGILVSATQGYLGTATSLAVPDLSGVSGFLAPPVSGTSVSWYETIYQDNYPSTTSQAGGSDTYVSVNGSYTVP